MKIEKNIEKSIFVLLMLALQKDHEPIKSNVFSRKLNVSDSYLKKVLRKLVLAGLITSTATRDGGFKLAKSIEEISMFDVYHAIENEDELIQLSHLAQNLFKDKQHVQQAENKIKELFSIGQQSFNSELKKFMLSELLIKENYQNGVIDWCQV